MEGWCLNGWKEKRRWKVGWVDGLTDGFNKQMKLNE